MVWKSTPGGRGRVTEKVVDDSPARFATRISEEALQGRAERDVRPAEEGGTRVDLRIDYDLSRGGPSALSQTPCSSAARCATP